MSKFRNAGIWRSDTSDGAEEDDGVPSGNLEFFMTASCAALYKQARFCAFRRIVDLLTDLSSAALTRDAARD